MENDGDGAGRANTDKKTKVKKVLTVEKKLNQLHMQTRKKMYSQEYKQNQ